MKSSILSIDKSGIRHVFTQSSVDIRDGLFLVKVVTRPNPLSPNEHLGLPRPTHPFIEKLRYSPVMGIIDIVMSSFLSIKLPCNSITKSLAAFHVFLACIFVVI